RGSAPPPGPRRGRCPGASRRGDPRRWPPSRAARRGGSGTWSGGPRPGRTAPLRTLPPPLPARSVPPRRRARASSCPRRLRLRPALHVARSQLGQLGDVAQALDGVRVGCEQLLPAQPDPLDQPEHEGIRAAIVEGAAGGPVEAKERLRPVAPLLRELRPFER